MSERGFIILLVVLALLLWAARSEFGGVVGLMTGLVLAWFVVGPALMLGLGDDGVIYVAIAIGAAWLVLAAFLMFRTVSLALAGEGSAARGRFATALTMVVVPVAAWLSGQTLQEMWPG